MENLFDHFSDRKHLVPFGFFLIAYLTLLQDGGLENTWLNFVFIVGLKIWIFYEQINSNFIVSKPTGVFFLGVVFSWVGGAYFDHLACRMAAFALAQFCYISVYGWKLAKLEIVICLCACVCAGVAEHVLLICNAAYVVLLLFICWRALARSSHRKEIYSAVGSEFAMFDAMIIINIFLPDQAIWILFLYCLTQLAITLNYRAKLFIRYSDRYRIVQ